MAEFLQLLLTQIRERKLVYVWFGLMLATWLWFDFALRSRMDGTMLTGAALFHAVVTLTCSALWTWGKQRAAAGRVEDALKQRRKGKENR
jgi:hypothetical protein